MVQHFDNASDYHKGKSRDGATEWWTGFENHRDKLECMSCAAVVRHSRESAQKHLEWHEALGQAIEASSAKGDPPSR